ncbi:GntR family transcriptional regulator [Paraburkholderia sp. BL25I1N1]|uniref:GntR family transcriptional regulator n=1 Tax=Paraburkholderia sp. BL25I1N1 TaxID=1938804 RepID=UPI000D04B9D4|nr:GntR family transcriptional regulator [Paraburkholderia sp. BL25I1N1]PRX90895.1 GntR family transcriptional regulator [Paraburkholderia sp. BL25I1N1]
MKSTLNGEPNSKVNARAPEVIASKLDDIRDQVRGLIQRGELRPGERVNEQALANQIGVGRNSAREALRSLEQAGLVRIVPNRGAEVRRLSLEEAMDLYEIRAGLARTAGRLAALRLTTDEEHLLGLILDQMDAAVAERDSRQYQNLNTEFHRQLMAATKNPRLITINQAVEDELTLYLHKGVYSFAQMQRSSKEHRELFEALRAGQADAAAEAFENHVQTGKKRMLDTVSTSPSERK